MNQQPQSGQDEHNLNTPAGRLAAEKDGQLDQQRVLKEENEVATLLEFYVKEPTEGVNANLVRLAQSLDKKDTLSDESLERLRSVTEKLKIIDEKRRSRLKAVVLGSSALLAAGLGFAAVGNVMPQDVLESLVNPEGSDTIKVIIGALFATPAVSGAILAIKNKYSKLTELGRKLTDTALSDKQAAKNSINDSINARM